MTHITPMTILHEARSWIGTPYKDQHSRKGVGADCLGFVRGVWEEVTGEKVAYVPRYTNSWKETKKGETLYEGACSYLHLLEYSPAQRGKLPEGLQIGDVLLFRMLPSMPAKHCGILGAIRGHPTLVHAQNQRSFRHSTVTEIPMDEYWPKKLAYAFRFREVT